MTMLFDAARRGHLKALGAALLAGAALSACAGFIGPRNVELPLARLQEGLERRFPLDRRVLSLFNVALSRPRLAILAEADRLALTMDVAVAPALMTRAWRGSVTLSGRLALNGARDAIVLADARLDRVAVDGVDEARQRQFAQAINAVARQFVQDVPLHRFHPDDLRYAGVQFAPARIATTPASLIVTFEPAN